MTKENNNAEDTLKEKELIDNSSQNSNVIDLESKRKIEPKQNEQIAQEQNEEVEKEIYDDKIIDFSKLQNLSDDEAIIELDKITGKNDELLERDYLSSLIEQKDRLVYYEVEGIYSNEKTRRFKTRLKLRKEPPTLIVRDEFDNEVKFYLTENLTDELAETLRQVKRAYYGFNGPDDINKPEKFFDKIKFYVKKNPFKLLTTIFLIVFVLSLSLL